MLIFHSRKKGPKSKALLLARSLSPASMLPCFPYPASSSCLPLPLSPSLLYLLCALHRVERGAGNALPVTHPSAAGVLRLTAQSHLHSWYKEREMEEGAARERRGSV